MAAVSTRCCRTPRTFIIFLFVLSGVVSETKTNVTGRNILYHSTDDGEKTCPAGAQGLYALPVLGPAGPFSPVRGFKVAEGGVASLSCQYSVKRFGLSRVCWGRGCGTFWCNNILVQTDEHGLISKVADRYRLTGDVLDGQMDLDILNVRRTDNGPYCCRVDVDGIFNDKKVIMNLRVVKAPVTSSPSPPPPPTMTTASATTGGVTEPSTSTVNWKTLLSSQLDLLRRNSTLLHSDAVAVEDSLPSLSLQINVPVLSLSLSVLLVLAATFLFLAFKRGIYRRALKNGCFSSEEPPHIIYEIRMKRPVQENIYTLD